jgi:hypothetical protein
MLHSPSPLPDIQAAETVKGKLAGGTLYAIVNNAGTGLKHGTDGHAVMDANLFGEWPFPT